MWTTSCTPTAEDTNSGPLYRDGGMQEITLKVVTAPGHAQVTDSLVVYRRDSRCPTDKVYDNPDKGPC